jgi:hypothetical protein
VTWVLYVGGGLVALFALLLLWGFLHLRGSRNQALAEVRKIELADLEALARECVEVFQRKLGVRLDLGDCEDAARKLDDAFRDRSKLKDVFARDDFYWYFVKPVGACLGELLRRHARHAWRKNPGEAPHLEVVVEGGESEAYPFEKVIKQSQIGAPGDLVAYVAFARALDRGADEEPAE